MYGESGTFKSSGLAEIARYLAWRYPAPDGSAGIVRLITADSSWGPLEEGVQDGYIQVWSLSTATSPLGLFRKACQGYWPTRLDPKTGKADEGSFVETKGLQWAGIAGYMYEGLTRVAELVMKDMKDKHREVGEPLQGKFTDAGVQLAGSSRGTYGFVQDYSRDWIQDARAKLLVPWVIVTGHEGKGEDLVTKKTVFGPATAGKSMTDKISGWFENTIHHESYQFKTSKDGETQNGVRAFFLRHTDQEVTNVYWPAKLGVTSKQFVAIQRKWPKGYIPLQLDEEGNYKAGCSLADLVEMIDDLSGVPAPQQPETAPAPATEEGGK